MILMTPHHYTKQKTTMLQMDFKSMRNCWSHSSVNGTRLMQVPHNSCLLSIDVCNFFNGKYITWKHLWDLYDKISELQASSCGLTLVPKLKRVHLQLTSFRTACSLCGLTLVPKLKREHLQLTSYSQMRVDLAAQVSLFFLKQLC